MKKILLISFMLFLVTAKAQRKNSNFSDENRRNLGIGLTLGGVGFTAAAILEGGSQYGTYVNSTPATLGASPTSTYVTPPVYKQTPRNIMFCVGVGFTFTGLITMLTRR